MDWPGGSGRERQIRHNTSFQLHDLILITHLLHFVQLNPEVFPPPYGSFTPAEKRLQSRSSVDRNKQSESVRVT